MAKQKQEEFRLITENMSEGFLIVDKNANLLSCNSSALRLLDAEKRRTELLHERERLAGKINPNVAFIEDDKIPPKEKKKIIDNSDNLVLLVDNKKYAKDAAYKEAFYGR